MKFLRLLDENFERWLMFALYSHIVAIVFVEVIRRFVFSYSSIWAEETARYAFIYLVWLGASAAIRDRSHIRIDIIFQFLSETLVKNKVWFSGGPQLQKPLYYSVLQFRPSRRKILIFY